MKSSKISRKEEMYDVIQGCEVCYLGMVDGDRPYVLPFNFGFEPSENMIWFHSGPGGRKTDILEKNSKVSIAFSSGHELHYHHKTVACSYSMKSRSVLVEGSVEFVEDSDEKIRGLDIIMKNYTDLEFSYSKPSIDNVVVFKVHIDQISGKKRGYV